MTPKRLLRTMLRNPDPLGAIFRAADRLRLSQKAAASPTCSNCHHWQKRDDERDRLRLTFDVGICTICSIASKSYDTCPNHTKPTA